MKSVPKYKLAKVLLPFILMVTLTCNLFPGQDKPNIPPPITQVLQVTEIVEITQIVEVTRIVPVTQLAPQKNLVEVANGKPTNASSFYQGRVDYSFSPNGIVDRKTNELSCLMGVEKGNTYWLLADDQTGWVEVNLLDDYQIVKLRWLNTHNGDCADRGTTQYHISVSETGAFRGEEIIVHSGEMAFTEDVNYQEIVLTESILAKYVRFYVDGYYNAGGGLNELEVYAESE